MRLRYSNWIQNIVVLFLCPFLYKTSSILILRLKALSHVWTWNLYITMSSANSFSSTMGSLTKSTPVTQYNSISFLSALELMLTPHQSQSCVIFAAEWQDTCSWLIVVRQNSTTILPLLCNQTRNTEDVFLPSPSLEAKFRIPAAPYYYLNFF